MNKKNETKRNEKKIREEFISMKNMLRRAHNVHFHRYDYSFYILYIIYISKNVHIILESYSNLTARLFLTF